MATAKTDFGKFVALKTLSPFSLHAKANVAGSQSALDAVWASVHASDFTSWTADRSARLHGDTTKEFDFSDQWYADRAAMLSWVINRNVANTDTARGNTPESYQFNDVALGKAVTVIGGLQAGGNVAAGNNPVRVTFGSNFADVLAGGDAAVGDHFFGMGGADTFSGNAGNDYIEGNADNDTLSGNDGNDTLLGGEGDDSLSGDNNDDLLFGGQGRDTLDGGDGRDQLSGGTEADILRGGIGVDTLDGGSGNDILTGGAGDDILQGGVGSDSYILAAGDGDDTIDDGDGLGEVRIGADRLSGGDAIAVGLWHQSVNGREVRYAFSPDANGRGDLLIQSSAGSTTVRNFKSGALGIVLNLPSPLTIAEPTPGGTVAGTAQDDNRLHKLSTPAISATLGNDRVQGLAGRDEIYGRDGDDIVEGGPGIDVAAGNDGNDAVFADGQLTEAQIRDYIATSSTAPTAGAMPAQLLVASSEWLQGGLGTDTVIGGDGNDILFGGGGKDILVGGAGHDLINGDDDFEPGDLTTVYVQPAVGNGAPFNAWYSPVVVHNSAWDAGAGDEIHAGSGDDAVYGEIGDDRIWGDDGNDTLAGNEDSDIVYGGNGDDQMAGDNFGVVVAGTTPSPNGNDFLDGGAGNDRIYGDGGSDTLLGGAGDDVLYGNNPIAAAGVSATAADDGADYLNGGDGNDHLIGDSGADTVFGGNGVDYLFGDSDITPAINQGGDFLDGGAGSDFLRGYGGDDTLLGGEGDDTIYGEAGNDYIDAGTGSNGVSGGDGDDVILGSDIASGDFNGNRLQGDAGHDRLSGEGFLLGGDGNDTLSTNGKYGISHRDSLLQGGNGDDTLSAPLGGASMYGDAGNDTLNGGTGISYMSGGDGNDIVVGGSGPNYAWGDAGDDRLDGGGGKNQLSGGGGNDWLAGYASDDVLLGDDGDDSLAGGGGRNYLAGGAGNDTYRIDLDGGGNFIADTEGANIISFGNGVTASQIVFREAMDSSTGSSYLVIDGLGGGGEVTILEGLRGGVSSFQFADGTSMTVQQVKDLANAPAGGPAAQFIPVRLDMIGSGNDDTIRAPGVSLTIGGGFGEDTIIGGVYDDNLQGEAGNDRLVGGGGRNTLTGGDGADTYVVGLKDGGTTIREQHLTLPAETDTIEFGAGVLAPETQLIRDGYDLVVAMKQGGAQVRISNFYVTSAPSFTGPIAQDAKIEVMRFADGTVWDSNQIAARIQSGTSNAITGTSADDVFVIDNALDTVTELPNNGNDTVRSSISYSLPANVERLELTGSLDANAWANLANPVNTLVGNDFNNIFDGPGGPNNSASGGGTGAFAVMYGGKGDDTYYYDYYKGGEVHESPGEGNDTIILTFGAGDFVLPANIENVQDVSSGMNRVVNTPDRLTGNDLDNFLGHTGGVTGSVSYVLDGGKGADTMQGGQWGDVYYVDNAGDRVLEAFYPAALTARDEIRSTIGYQLPDFVEDLTLLGEANVEAWGNALGNILDGSQNAASNRLVGGVGDDRYIVGPDDIVVENADEGADTIEFRGTGARTYAFADAPANVEGIALGSDLGESALQGDDGDNYLGGNASANVIAGNDGNDTIEAGDGADTIIGGVGDDLLQGQGGSDTYQMGRGFGRDEIRDGAGSNRIVLDSTLNAADYYFDGGELRFHGTEDAIHLASASTYSSRPDGEKVVVAFVGDMAFSDGTSISASELDAMLAASFSHASTDRADTIEGTASSDTLNGIDGNDFLWGRAGDDRLAGGAQDDRLFGGDGSDTLDGDNGQDQLSGGAGNDTLRGDAGADTLHGDNGNDLLDGGAGGDTLHGDAGDDTLDGGTEADTLYGDDGNDTLAGGADMDKLYGGIGNDTLNGGADADELYGDDGDDVLVAGDATDLTDGGSRLDGGAGNDTLQGGAGGDSLLGGDGNDTLDGGAGDDFIYDVAGNNTLRGGEGDDRLQVATGDNVLDGGAGTDVLWGASGADSYVLKSGGGVDTVIEDWFGAKTTVLVDGGLRPADVTLSRVDDVDGSYFEASANGGADKLRMRYMPEAAPVEVRFADGTVWDQATVFDKLYVRRGTAGNDTLTAGIGNSQLYGYAGNDTLVGGDYNDLLDGGTGADAMTGGLGNDTYVVDDPGDMVVESAPGYDTVNAGISYVLPTNVMSLSLTGTTSINGTGNSLGNTIIGNSAGNVLDGKAGADTLRGGAGDDTYVIDNAADAITENAGEGSDLVQSSVTYTLGANLENLALTGSAAISGTGNSADNVVIGNSGANIIMGALGNDLLDGGAGVDTMKGGAGNDTYVVDNAGDIVTELANEGTDLVTSTATFTLAANIENLTLVGSAAVNATGNALNNRLMGNSGINMLSGAAGADTMIGGAGNDTYVVDAAGDAVIENAGEGTDLVQSSIGYTLAANVENLTLTGSAAINGTGNALSNTLTGNIGNNVLDGGAGADALIGGAGNDTYVVEGTGDMVTEAVGAGTDLVQAGLSWTLGANLENLTLTGVAAISGTGNALNNALTGNAADNQLDGGTGADALAGGFGNDTYVVDNAGDTISETVNAGYDLVQSGVTTTLAANVEYLTLIGTMAINGTGNALDNWLQGNSAQNSLDGGGGNDMLWGAAADDILLGNAGNDLVQGGLGNDTLTDAAGNNLLDGGAGLDTLTGGAAHDVLVGGTGADTLTTGGGADVIAYDKGDGADVVNASIGTDDTLSLGGGLAYGSLALRKSGLDLILDATGGDQITFKNWYQVGVNNKSILNLQVVTDAMAAFNPSGGDPLLNRKVVNFNFGGLVSRFDASLAANPTLTSWNLTNALATCYLTGSDSAAIGGDFAYDYGHRHALSGIGAAPGQNVLAGAGLGSAAQTLQTAATLYSGNVRLQ